MNFNADGAPDITHEGSISALLKSLQTPVRSKKPYFIHTSGAALIWDNARGTPSERVWDDVADIAEIRALPAEYTHKLTDSVMSYHYPLYRFSTNTPPTAGS